MNSKPFMTHEQLLQLLESRGIVFSDMESRAFAKKKLQRIGYYSLINGYSSLFMDPQVPDHYLPGTTIDQIYNVYHFDQKLREIFLKNILPFETNIKALIAYYFPMHHPEENYLIYTNFNTNVRESNAKISSLIASIQRQIADRSSDPSISHYLTKYGNVPLWVLNNALTMGNISKFYSLMQPAERIAISKTFHIMDNELESILLYVSSIRNFCAHGNRLYCYRSKRPLINTLYHASMGIPVLPSGEYLFGKRDLFAVVIALKIVLSKKEFRKFIKDIDIALKNLDAHLNTISLDAVLSAMGFPHDWKTLALI